jgi:hypothetical protein
MKLLKIVAPGRRYSSDRSLLYFIDKYTPGETIRLNYDREFDPNMDLDDLIVNSLEFSKKVLNSVDFSQYDGVIFLAKSLGTVVSIELKKYFNLESARIIALTPIHRVVPLLEDEDFLVCGTKDHHIDDGDIAKIVKMKHSLVLKDLPHSLENEDLAYTLSCQRKVIEESIKYIDDLFPSPIEKDK